MAIGFIRGLFSQHTNAEADSVKAQNLDVSMLDIVNAISNWRVYPESVPVADYTSIYQDHPTLADFESKTRIHGSEEYKDRVYYEHRERSGWQLGDEGLYLDFPLLKGKFSHGTVNSYDTNHQTLEQMGREEMIRTRVGWQRDGHDHKPVTYADQRHLDEMDYFDAKIDARSREVLAYLFEQDPEIFQDPDVLKQGREILRSNIASLPPEVANHLLPFESAMADTDTRIRQSREKN